MVFTSWTFAIFFLVVLVVLAICRTRTSRQVTILVASVIFYGYWNHFHLLLLATPSIIDYYCAQEIERRRDRARTWVTLSVVSNLGLLTVFKYTNFFLENISALLGFTSPTLHIVLPIGISFYTFKTLSYTIDVYRGEIPACRDWWKYAMFVTYFPELIAGPIVRASVFLPQMTRSLRPSWPRAWVGCQAILLGLTKKSLIADRMSPLVDSVFAHPHLFSPLTVASAVVAYSLQIYCDFSGYSDMAIGISRIIGYDLPENFNLPYLSTSITEFWRRWHITLSTWLRDYLYIPLGGSRRGKLRTWVNLILTMLLGGLWHGASWTFVAWGLLHGTGLALHKIWAHKNKEWGIPVPPMVSWALTYVFVCFGWLVFRSPDAATALVLLRKLTFMDSGGVEYFYLPLALALPVVIAAHWLGRFIDAPNSGLRSIPVPAFAQELYRDAGDRLAVKPHPTSGYYFMLPLPGFFGAVLTTAWVLLLYLFSAVQTSPFIYFQF